MLYVIGVDHRREQYPHPMNVEDRVRQLQKTVREVCKEKHIQLIAEEWCDDARDNSSTGTTYTEDIAAELGIKYLASDPGTSERVNLQIKSRYQIAQELGIPFPMKENPELENKINATDAAKEADAKREAYWLEKIKELGGTEITTLLVCGYEHANSFVALAKAKGYEAVRQQIF